MRHKKNTPEAKVHGHIKNNFHTVATPGFSRSFYLGGEDIALLTAHLESQGKKVDKSSLGELAHEWFQEMMRQKKHEFLKSPPKSSENT